MDALLLHSTHSGAGASFGSRGGRETVAHYGSPADEYQAARSSAVLVDLSFRDALRISGEDRLSYFHGMCTQDIKGLPEWGSAYFTIVSVKGSMVADGRAVRRPDDLVIDLEPGTTDHVREFLEKYLISEDAELHAATGDVAVVGLVGPRTEDVLKAAFGEQLPEGVVRLPSLLTKGPGTELLLPTSRLEELWNKLRDSGARPAGLEALEWVRVEDGVPRFGQDLLETTIPLEADLKHAIHYNKGCYVGQEVIARGTFRGQMNKKLTGLVLGESGAPERAELRKDGKKVGFLTSVVRSPSRGEYVALGYVHRDHLTSGTVLEVADAAVTATVQELPFPRDSVGNT
ncbi:MAG: glycine cleavage T C-terminal barrel domain-containing protein [Myxococcaceae bacterium]